MKHKGSRYWLRVLVALVVASLAFGVVACGGSDDSSGGGDRSVATANSSDSGEKPVSAGSPEAEVEAAYNRFDDAMRSGDAKTACALFTDKGRKQFETFGSLDKPCQARVKSLSKKLTNAKTKVESIRINGDTARMVQSAPGVGKALLILRKEDGAWKLHSTSGS